MKIENDSPNTRCNVLLLEKINHRFKRMTKTKQSSGLSICIDHISKSVNGIQRAEIDNIENILSAIQKWKPKKIVLEGIWVSRQFIEKIKHYYSNIDIFVHVHSNVPFLVCESTAIQNFMMYQSLGVGIIFNSSNAYEAFICLEKSIYLPNIYVLTEYESKKEPNEFIDVGCFGSVRLLKNQIIQALASANLARRLGKKLRFHMNLGRGEGKNDDIISTLKGVFTLHSDAELISVPWLEHKDFIQYCRGLDIGLQVSLSETFNIVSADYVSAGIPIVVSQDVCWADQSSIASTSSPKDIENKMWLNIKHHKDYLNINRESLKAWNKSAIRKWDEFTN